MRRKGFHKLRNNRIINSIQQEIRDELIIFSLAKGFVEFPKGEAKASIASRRR
jgi:hypothetical protein